MSTYEREQISDWLEQCRHDTPLEPGDKRYVPLEDTEADGQRVTIRGGDCTTPLFDCITLTKKPTCQLFSGYIGTGKSTELRRLKERLEEANYVVLMADAADYHDLSHPLSIEDLLVIIAGAIGDRTADIVGQGVLQKDYWERLMDFLQTEVKLDEAKIPATGLDLKVSLQGATPFWLEVRNAMATTLGRFKQNAHEFIRRCVEAVIKKTASGLRDEAGWCVVVGEMR